MTTHRFQPGDKVRVGLTRVWAADLGLSANVTYTVAHVDDFGQVSLQGLSTYFHPSHFELVMRLAWDAAASYSLKDGEGDWWVFDTTNSRWQYVMEMEGPSWHTSKVGFEEGIEHIVAHFDGFDAEESSDAALAELRQRLSEPETYCLKDGDGDWWISDDGETFRWVCGCCPVGEGKLMYSLGDLLDEYSLYTPTVDAEPLPAVAEGPLRAGPGQIFYAPLVDVEPEVDQRITAWNRVASHPVFNSCYEEERPLIDAMMAKLDGLQPASLYGKAKNGRSVLSIGDMLDDERTPFVPGDRVRVVSTSATHRSHYYANSMHAVGTEFTVAGVGKVQDGPFVEDDRDYYWHPADLEKVTDPAPLQTGDAVLVWAKVVNPEPDSDGEIAIALHRAGRMDEMTDYALPDAIVRPADGATPPWVEEQKAERCTSLKQLRAGRAGEGALLRCTRTVDGHGMTGHRNGHRAWTDAEAYGRVEVTER